MDPPFTGRVQPVCQSPRPRMYGYFTMELFHLPALAHPARSLSPAIFAGRLPRPTLVAACAVTRLSPRLRYYSAVRLLTKPRTISLTAYRSAFSGITRRLGQSS